MGAHRFYRYLLTIAILMILLTSTGGLYAAKASGEAVGVNNSRIQQGELTNKVFLPCIFNNVCFPTFFDDFGPQSSGWDSYVNPNPPISVGVSNGEYIMDISGPKNVNDDPIFATGSNPSLSGSDYKVIVSVSISQAPAPAEGNLPQYGLFFDRDVAGETFLAFEIVSDGEWYLWKYEKINGTDTWTSMGDSLGLPDSHINQGTAVNRLGVERSGSFVNLYANGFKLNTDPISASNGVTNGFIGLIADNSSTGVSRSYYFDNFGLFPVTCDWASIFNGSFTPTPIAQLQSMPALTPLSGRIAPKPR